MNEYINYQELALFVLGYSQHEVEKMIEKEDIQDLDIKHLLNEKFDVDIDTFINLADALLKFTPPIESPLSKKRYHSFAVQLNKRNLRSIIKIEVEPND